MNALEVRGLCKKYPTFELKDACFALEEGKITGFIGRNGAGKTTALKSILNFIHPDSGEIEFFGMNFSGNEMEIKQRIGFVSGGINYYSKKKIKAITDVTKRFYKFWDNEAYKNYLQLFNLDENKTPSELSEGMKVKYALTLALSHNADLLILDEPTSGLDPVSRDELLDIFMELCDKGITILFSTHITSDLDKCADNIIYIKEGRIIANDSLENFVSSYRVVENPENMDGLIGLKRTKTGCSALVKKELGIGIDTNLEQIMVHMEKEKM